MWQKIEPLKPGFYWYRAPSELLKDLNPTPVVHCVHAYGRGAPLFFTVPGEQYPKVGEEMIEKGEFWSEPLQPPPNV